VKRPWVLLGVLAVLIVAGAAHGTLALRRCLEAVGGTVRTADTPPDGPAVFVLLNDSGLTPNGELVPTPACHGFSPAGAKNGPFSCRHLSVHLFARWLRSGPSSTCSSPPPARPGRWSTCSGCSQRRQKREAEAGAA